MTTNSSPSTRPSPFSRRLRSLTTHLPGRAADRLRKGADEEPQFTITHTPDRPTWPIGPAEAPSDDACRREIRAWHRQAGLATSAAAAAAAARGQDAGRWPLHGDSDSDACPGGGSDSEYEDVLVHDDDDDDDGETLPHIQTSSLPTPQPRPAPAPTAAAASPPRRLGETTSTHGTWRSDAARGSTGRCCSVETTGASSSSYDGEVAVAAAVGVPRLRGAVAARARVAERGPPAVVGPGAGPRGGRLASPLGRAAHEAREERRGSAGWELDLVSLYDAAGPLVAGADHGWI